MRLDENTIKDKFHDELLFIVSKFDEQTVVVAGSLNGHVGRSTSGYGVVHGEITLGRETLRVNEFLSFVIQPTWW